jgi:hypothetical protein
VVTAEPVERHEEAAQPPEPVDPRLLASELVLVCPELRAISLSLLPDRDPDGFLPRTRSVECLPAPIPIAAPAAAVAADAPVAVAEAEPTPEGFREIAVAGLARVVSQVLLTLVTGAAIFAGIAGLVILATSVR